MSGDEAQAALHAGGSRAAKGRQSNIRSELP